MKILVVSLFLLAHLMALASDSILGRRGEFIRPDTIDDPIAMNFSMLSEMEEQNADLKKVKYYMINGETRLARVYLSKMAYSNTKMKPIIHRYLALLTFIEGNFQKSLEYLSIDELKVIPHYSRICVLKTLNLIVLDRPVQLEKEWPRCSTENFKNFSDESYVWIDTLVKLKLHPRKGVTKKPFTGIKLAAMSNEQLKIFLKLAIYLNQESLVENQLTDLQLSQLDDIEVREILGHIHFRLGSLKKSYRLIEDLSSPNAENIKGNLYVLREKLELAYAQFKLALEQKQNSQNAMERILPLAWILKDWEEGAKISERVISSPQTLINKMTLVAAFHAQKGDYNRAKEVMDAISIRSQMGTEIEVTQLQSFVGLMQNKVHIAKKQALISCSQYDLVNCWLGVQLDQWGTFPLTIRRGDGPPARKEWEKLSQEYISEPLNETVYVNQLDIEELDDKLIRLTPHDP